MPLPPEIRSRLALPAVCAPMTMVSGPELVAAACKAGVMAGLPRHNAASLDEFAAWMAQISEDLARFAGAHPHRPVAPMAVNLSGSRIAGEVEATLDICQHHGVTVFISAMGNPRELAAQVHDRGGVIWHDVTTLAHAEKAIAAGVDGLTCIGAGGGGHSGPLSHLALVPRVRQMFDGTIVMAGAVTTGAAIRAAEILGADLAYLGTRFIAAQESRAPLAYKQMLVSESAGDLMFTPRVTGVLANWLKASLRAKGLDPDNLPVPTTHRSYDHLPGNCRPWRDLFSAGQGIELIEDVPPVAILVERLAQEYLSACRTPVFEAAERLAAQALDTPL